MVLPMSNMDRILTYPKKVKLESIIDHWYFGTILLFLLMKMLFLFYRILNVKRDSWKKTTSVYHRNEESKYIGGILNISVNSYSKEKKDIQVPESHGKMWKYRKPAQYQNRTTNG